MKSRSGKPSSIELRKLVAIFSGSVAAKNRLKASRTKFPFVASRPVFYLLVLGFLTLGVLSVSLPVALTANPAGGTLTNASGPLTYTGGPFFVANVTAQANGEPDCTAPMSCDDFALTIAVTPPVTTLTHKVKIVVQWPVASADFDVYIYQGAAVVATAASSSDPEVAFISPVNGVYTIRTVPFAPAGQSYTATVSLEPIPAVPPPPLGIAPRYQNYPAPPDLAGSDSAGEPSIGVDWNINCPASTPGCANLHPSPAQPKLNTGGVAFFTANLNEFRVSFDDCSSPAGNFWEDKTSPFENQESLDPIGFVDHQTGRVFQSQLAGASSILAYSDDDGETWTQSQGSGQPAGVDHQTVGGGPYNPSSTPPPPPHPLYPNTVYYASQDVATALAARSDNGGLTFGPGIAMWNLTQCGGLHGHVKVGPDGTVYVPNKGCGGMQGVAVSTDNGLTWTLRSVPNSTPGDTDPSVGIGTDNTLYLGYQNGDGHPHIARSTDHGQTWIDRDAGGGFIQNCVFPEVVAGDGDRAAFGFLGTATGGNYQDATNFHGIWHFYIATTFDRGDTYYLVDATPGDPVQIGSICTGGTTCGSDRNLLDFNDIGVDKEGRVLAAYADGCVAPGCIENPPSPSTSSRSAKATIIRQSGGRRLFAAFDPVEPAVPGAPRLINATRDSMGVTVRWDVPDDGASPLTSYKVYRGTTSGTETFLASIGPSTPKYLDTTAGPMTQYVYRVTAVNAINEGPFCGEVLVSGSVNPCVAPGITVLTDPPGDALDMNAAHDILSVSVFEPLGLGAPHVGFVIRVASLAVVPPNTGWPVTFTAPNGTTYFAKMETSGAGAVSFAYGSGAVTGAGTPAHASSNFLPDGTITVVVPLSGIGSPTPGQNLTAFLIRVRVNPAGVTLDNCPDSLGPSGSYTIAGCTGPVPPPDKCHLPGAVITTDPGGDQTGAPGNSQLDIREFDLAEPFRGSCLNTLVFTLKVADLSTVPPQARWTIFFTRPNGTEYYVSMGSDDSGNPTGVVFKYGHTEIVQGIRNLVEEGDADAGSTFSPDGTIIIAISNSKLTFTPGGPAPPPAAGETLSTMNAITQQTIGVLLATIDSTGNGTYTLVGVLSCQANNAPIASLSATPTEGDPPLIVNFNGSTSSDPDLCDSVVSFTFTFGDGSPPVTQASATISHTYNSPGAYRATLQVTDSHGRLSDNTALALIEVQNCLSTSTVSSTGGCFTGDAFNGTVDVTAENGCGWTAMSHDAWITITAGGSGSGNGTVSYSLAANPTRIPRQGTMTVAGHMFTALQGITFLDVPMSNVFYTDIGKLSAKGITVGCDSQNYCPGQSVTRAEMAVFIVRALGIFDPPPPASQRFTDVPPSHWAYAFIEELARRGITVGCGGGNFCPDDPVTREQMAAFIMRALGEFNPPTPGSQRFQDVPPSNQFYAFIDRLAALGITMGCQPSPPLYCPSDPVPREQMAAFLNRAFGCP